MASLLALFGPKRGVRIDVAGVVTVGRSSATDIQLIDEKVSREHCRFTTTNTPLDGGSSGTTVEDLGSHNGTYVNGERITGPTLLVAGDEIAVGDSLFVLDGAVDVAAARFGDATLIVSPPAPGDVVREATEQVETPSASQTASPQLATVTVLANALAAAFDTESAARALLAAMDAALHPDRAFVLLWDGARKQATPLVGKSDGSAVSISRTVLESAAAVKKAVFVDDAVESRDLKDAKSVIRHRLRSVVVAPIVSQGRVAGFLHADRRSRGAYGIGDAAVLEALAAVVSLHGLGGAVGIPRTTGGATPRPSHSHLLETTERHTEPLMPRPVGRSPALEEALRISLSAAGVSSTLLVTGESGTGKEEIARHVHGSSARGQRAFVAVNCGAIPEALAESELFGHEKGSFTGATATREGKIEAADGGTLFLDEVGELAPSVQVKLLRVLQERAFYRVGSTIPRRVDLRVIAATHRDLEADVKSGRFREDLFYRLNVLRIHLPPLRDRPEDLEPLARALLSRIAMSLGKADPGLSDDGLAALRNHRWPGNARELGNVLERMLVLRRAQDLGPLARADVTAALGAGAGAALAAAGAAGAGSTLADKIAELERAEVEAALRRARGVKTRAAEALGISRPTLDKKIADLGIDLWQEGST